MQITFSRILDFFCYLKAECDGNELSAALAEIRKAAPEIDEGELIYRAANRCLDTGWEDVWTAFAAEHGLQALDEPFFDISALDAGGFKFDANVPLIPAAVDAEGYRGIPVTAEVALRDRQQVEDRINAVWRKSYTTAEQKGPAVKDSVVFLDYRLEETDELKFLLPAAQDVAVALGAAGSEPHPGMEKLITGHRAGETVSGTVLVAPAKIVGTPSVAKEARCEITIRKVCRKEYPPLDDRFARTQGYDSLAAWRAAVREELDGLSRREAERQARAGAIDRAGSCYVGPPVGRELRDQYYDEHMRRLQEEVFTEPGAFEKYIYRGWKGYHGYKLYMNPIIEEQLKTRMALLRIAEKEGLEPSREDLDRACRTLAAKDKTSVEEAGAAHLRYKLRYEAMIALAGGLVAENAAVTLTPAKTKAPSPAATLGG